MQLQIHNDQQEQELKSLTEKRAALEQEILDLQTLTRELHSNNKQKTLDLRNLQEDNQHLKKVEMQLSSKIDQLGKSVMQSEHEELDILNGKNEEKENKSSLLNKEEVENLGQQVILREKRIDQITKKSKKLERENFEKDQLIKQYQSDLYLLEFENKRLNDELARTLLTLEETKSHE